MIDWKKILVLPSTPIIKAIEIIDAGALQIALVVDEKGILLGTVTDGDIRRGILRGVPLNEPVNRVMNSSPTVARVNEEINTIISTMKNKNLFQIPVVDDGGRVVDLAVLKDLIMPGRRRNIVVIMAGGLGSRLRPLTDDCPKPLLKVGGKPLLETILENFMEYGFNKFYFSVNYKADMIKKHFGDGSRWGVDIEYIYEEKRMGTAGPLGLLPEKTQDTILVMNGDLLTKINFQHLLDFHSNTGADATMCVKEYNFQIPYGVVKIARHRLIEIEEKPVKSFFISAGIYAIEPRVLDLIPPNTYFDMPGLFERLIQENRETAVFPIREYWLDIGHKEDFERANGEFSEVFL
ncbi:MAG: nucleotidyltransferase family protein [Peptococcaceae bacterium]|nr:nucleotidyltransferase family protein [Peptococcaceae bacterium]